MSYRVDGLGRRVARFVDGVADAYWLYGGFGAEDGLNPVAQLDAAGNVVQQYVYATRLNVPDMIVAGGETYRVLSDQVGSVRRIVNTARGATVLEREYSPYGVLEFESGSLEQPFGYAGGLEDPLTGLVRFGARDYDPEIGRWTAKDPILTDGGVNLYEYGASAPQMFVDATGRHPILYWLVIGTLALFAEDHSDDNTPFSPSAFPTRRVHADRNHFNRCPEREPRAHMCIGADRDGYLHEPSGKWRWSDGSECAYDENGRYIPGAPSFNFEASPYTPAHVWYDVLPHFLYGGLDAYTSPDPTTLY